MDNVIDSIIIGMCDNEKCVKTTDKYEAEIRAKNKAEREDDK